MPEVTVVTKDTKCVPDVTVKTDDKALKEVSNSQSPNKGSIAPTSSVPALITMTLKSDIDAVNFEKKIAALVKVLEVYYVGGGKITHIFKVDLVNIYNFQEVKRAISEYGDIDVSFILSTLKF